MNKWIEHTKLFISVSKEADNIIIFKYQFTFVFRKIETSKNMQVDPWSRENFKQKIQETVYWQTRCRQWKGKYVSLFICL